MEHNCERHTFENAEGQCRSCRGSFCAECLLWPFGPNEAPFCKPCAITAGGIRSTARNTRRMTPAETKKANGTKRGLFARLRGGGEDDEVVVEETPEELIEREANEARQLLDAQRLPTEVVEEDAPEPTPTPNIAPPGALHEDRELSHRSMPDSVSGGLDLAAEADPSPTEPSAEIPSTNEDPAAPTSDDTPAWARPDAAEAGEDTTVPTPEPVEDTTPDWARPDAAGDTAPTAVSTDWTDSTVMPGPTPEPTPREPVPSFSPEEPPPAVTAPEPAIADAAPATTTADGQTLFAAPAAETPPSVPSEHEDGREVEHEDEQQQAFEDEDASAPALQSTAVAATTINATPRNGLVTAGAPSDTDELLRRIAELRGR